MWCDEVKLETGEPIGQIRVTSKKGEAYLTECMAPTFESGCQALMAWGCVAHGFKGPLIQLKTEPITITPSGRKKGGGVGTQTYADQIISGPMKDCLAYLEKGRGHPMLVVEDGAPAHRGKTSRLARERHDIHQLPHPPNSPDLNPIEPVWRLLKTHIGKMPESRRSLEHRWAAAQSAWDSITVEEIT